MLNYLNKGATALGLTAAIGGGVLAGVESAIMWSGQKILSGVSFGVSSSFINSLSYYYVVMRASAASQVAPEEEEQYHYPNTVKSSAFAAVALLLASVMMVSNFNGMYISYTVLGEKLNELGDTTLVIPDWLLKSAGITFGIASAASGAVFNFKVAKSVWNQIRRSPVHQAGLFAGGVVDEEDPGNTIQADQIRERTLLLGSRG